MQFDKMTIWQFDKMTIISSSQYWESMRWSRGCRGVWCRAPATGRWESAPRNRFRPAEASKDQHGEEARPECMPVIQFPDTFPIISSSCPPGVMGDGSRRMLRHGATGMRFFRRESWLPGAGDSRRRIYPGRCSTCFSFRSVRVGQTGESAQQPPTRTSFSPMNLLTPARIQARSTQCVWVRHALMSSATDFGCKVTARKLRSKIFPPFFSKFFAINDTCQSIVKLSNCQIVKLSNTKRGKQPIIRKK